MCGFNSRREADSVVNKRKLTLLATGLLASLALAAASVWPSLPAQAALTLVGPVNPATGFPQWLQDANGLRLQPCLLNASPAAAGPCFAATGLPNPAAAPA